MCDVGMPMELQSHLGPLIKVNNVQRAICQEGNEGDMKRGLGVGG